jgi:hypothetical protein
VAADVRRRQLCSQRWGGSGSPGMMCELGIALAAVLGPGRFHARLPLDTHQWTGGHLGQGEFCGALENLWLRWPASSDRARTCGGY